MNSNELILDFIEHTKNAETAQDILEAIKNLGAENAEKIAGFIADFCKKKGIDPNDPALAEYRLFSDSEKALKNVKNGVESIKKDIAKFESEKEKRTPDDWNALCDQIKNTAEAAISNSKSPAKNKFASWEDFLKDSKNYDPSKEFTPSFFAGLPFPNGTLSYIGARPGIGKSALLINIARETVFNTNRKVFFVNLEMNTRAIFTRFFLSTMYALATDDECKELDREKEPIKRFYQLFGQQDDTRETFDSLRRKTKEKMDAVCGKCFFIHNGESGDYETIINDLESLVSDGDVVLIDYIQRVPTPKGGKADPRYVEIKKISNAFLLFALRKNLVIISAAQRGRDKNNTDLGDFRESGDIEQDAHNAIFLDTLNDNSEKLTAGVVKARESQKITAGIDFIPRYFFMHSTGKEAASKKRVGKSKEEANVMLEKKRQEGKADYE